MAIPATTTMTGSGCLEIEQKLWDNNYLTYRCHIHCLTLSYTALRIGWLGNEITSSGVALMLMRDTARRCSMSGRSSRRRWTSDTAGSLALLAVADWVPPDGLSPTEKGGYSACVPTWRFQ